MCDTTVSRMMKLGNEIKEMMTVKKINSTNAPSIVLMFQQ